MVKSFGYPTSCCYFLQPLISLTSEHKLIRANGEQNVTDFSIGTLGSSLFFALPSSMEREKLTHFFPHLQVNSFLPKSADFSSSTQSHWQPHQSHRSSNARYHCFFFLDTYHTQAPHHLLQPRSQHTFAREFFCSNCRLSSVYILLPCINTEEQKQTEF